MLCLRITADSETIRKHHAGHRGLSAYDPYGKARSGRTIPMERLAVKERLAVQCDSTEASRLSKPLLQLSQQLHRRKNILWIFVGSERIGPRHLLLCRRLKCFPAPTG